MEETTISNLDISHLKLIRENVIKFISFCAVKHDKKGAKVLDIAPQDHEGAMPFFRLSDVKTLDIDSNSDADYIADICVENSDIIPSNFFDIIICTEVLEHTLNPFAATTEIFRILKKGGVVCVSTPFNFRIHGPLPDCWRFTLHGLNQLFADFKNVQINPLETKGRKLMPIQYTLIASK